MAIYCVLSLSLWHQSAVDRGLTVNLDWDISDTGKQSRPRLDATERGIWSGSPVCLNYRKLRVKWNQCYQCFGFSWGFFVVFFKLWLLWRVLTLSLLEKKWIKPVGGGTYAREVNTPLILPRITWNFHIQFADRRWPFYRRRDGQMTKKSHDSHV